MTPVREANGTCVCEPAEEWREKGLHGRLGEYSPCEDDQDACDDLEQRDENPGRDRHGRVKRGSGHYGREEVCVEGGQNTLGAPETNDHAADDGYKGDSIFKAGAIIHG